MTLWTLPRARFHNDFVRPQGSSWGVYGAERKATSYTANGKQAPSLLQLLLGAQLVGVAALLLAAVDGARVQAGVAPARMAAGSVSAELAGRKCR